MKWKIGFVLLAGGTLACASFANELGVVEMDEVVVTGTRTEKKLSETPVRTELIRRDEIAAMAAGSLADAVEFSSGVRVENNCQNCGFNQLRLLGLKGAYSQILVDGQPLRSSLAAVYGVEQIPARAIDRIEIVKGGGSALYGPGAVAGVVNIISRDPVTSGGEIEAQALDVDGAAGHTVNAISGVVSSNGLTKMTVYGQVDERDAYDRDEDGFSDLTERRQESFGLRLRQQVAEDADITLHYSRTYEDRRGGDRLEEAALVYERAARIAEVQAEALVAHAQLEVQRERYATAAGLLESAQALQPNERVGRYLAQVRRLNELDVARAAE